MRRRQWRPWILVSDSLLHGWARWFPLFFNPERSSLTLTPCLVRARSAHTFMKSWRSKAPLSQDPPCKDIEPMRTETAWWTFWIFTLFLPLGAGEREEVFGRWEGVIGLLSIDNRGGWGYPRRRGRHGERKVEGVCRVRGKISLRAETPNNQARQKSTEINFLGPETTRWGGGLPCEGVGGRKVRSLPWEFLLSLRNSGKTRTVSNATLVRRHLSVWIFCSILFSMGVHLLKENCTFTLKRHLSAWRRSENTYFFWPCPPSRIVFQFFARL